MKMQKSVTKNEIFGCKNAARIVRDKLIDLLSYTKIIRKEEN